MGHCCFFVPGLVHHRCLAYWHAVQSEPHVSLAAASCFLQLIFRGAQGSSTEQPLDTFHSNVAEMTVPLQKFLLGLAQVAVV